MHVHTVCGADTRKYARSVNVVIVLNEFDDNGRAYQRVV